MTSAAVPFPYPFAFDDVFAANLSRPVTLGDFTLFASTKPVKGESLYLGALVASKENGISADVSFESATRPFALNFSLASKRLPNDWRALLPAVTYFFDNAKRNASVTVKAATNQVSFELTDKMYRVNGTTAVLDGLTTDVRASVRLADDVYGGLSFIYDPHRSGLKFFKYSALWQGVKQLRNGNAMVTYDSLTGLNGAVGFPLCSKSSATVLVTPRSAELVAGVSYQCPCGTRVAGDVSLSKKLFRLSATRLIAGKYTVTLGSQANISTSSPQPKFGLSISSEQ